MDVDQFFNAFADRINQQQGQELTPFFSIPSMDMCGQNKQVINHEYELAEYLTMLQGNLSQGGERFIEAEIRTQLRLSADMMFCIVHWHQRPASGQCATVSPTSYTLQLNNGEIKHILATVRE